VTAEIARLGALAVPASDSVNALLAASDSSPVTQTSRAIEILRRPEISYATLMRMLGESASLTLDEAAELEVDVKYDGYVKRQAEAIERFKRLEDAAIPDWVDFGAVTGLSTEVRERLSAVRPQSLGQAARMPGVTPAAISLLAVHIKSGRNRAARAV